MNYPLNSTDVSLIVQIVDDSGFPVESLTAADFPAVSILRGTSSTALTPLVDLASIASSHTDGGLKEFSNGRYRLDIPDSYFAVTGVMSLVAEESDKRLLHPELYVGSTVASGEGPRSVSIKVTDGTNPVQNATVRMFLNAEDYRSNTGVDGIVEEAFGLLNDGVWNVVVGASGHASLVTTLSVTADIAEGDQVYSLTANALAGAVDPTRCQVATYVKENGVAVPGARMEARLLGRTNATATGVESEKMSAVSDSNGLVSLDLIRLDQFVDGDGVYEIIVTNNKGQELLRTKSSIPNAASAWLESLL